MDYFKTTNQDLLDIQEMDANDYNKFVHSHHYAKCAACGNEYLYVESPVVTHDNWEKILKFFGLSNNEITQIQTIKGCNVGSSEAKLNRVNTLLKVCKDSVLICPHCMEKALGRKLTIDDLLDCNMSRDYIKKFIKNN